MGIERVIIAKHSPKNQCFADDGELLIAAAPSAKASIRVRKRGHFFVGLTTGKPSLVGWTDTPSQSITEDQIIMQAQQCPHPELLGMNRDQIAEQVRFTLEGAGYYAAGKPVITDFTERSVEDKSLVQTIHRVFLQKMSGVS